MFWMNRKGIVKSEEKITEVQGVHRFNETALAEYLTGKMDGFSGPLVVRQFEGGQSNPTYLLSTPEKNYVLRKKPPGDLLPSAHQVNREYRVMTALRGTDVPVPRTFHLCEDDSVIGAMFFVMEYVNSRLYRNAALPGLAPEERRTLYADIIRVLAALHGVDFKGLGLGDYGKSGDYVARQIRRWTRQYEAAMTEDIPAMNKLIEYLPNNVPEEDETCLVHGDFRLDNLLLHPEKQKVVALLDWELSTLGHPLSDLAYACLMYNYEVIPGVGTLSEIAGPESGIPTEAEYVAEYCRLTGRESIPKWNYYLSFSLFRLAAILQGVYKRGLMGIASSTKALERGRHARTAAEIAWSLFERDD